MRIAPLLLLAWTACAGAGAPTPASTTPSTPPAASASSASSAIAAESAAPPLAAPSTSAQPPEGGPPPEPMASTLPLDLGKKTPPFPVRAVAPDTISTVAHGAVPVPEGLASHIDPAAPFFMWEQVMPRHVVLTFPRHAGLDLYVVLFDGELSIKADDIEGKQKRLWPWNAARVPGLGVMVECKEPTRAVFVLVANTPGGTLAQAAAAAPKAAWARRPAPVVSVELDKQPDLAWAGGAYHARLGLEDGSASVGALMASKSAPVSPHVHEHAWEILAILSGDGTLVRTRDGREDATRVAAGTFVSIAPGVPHAYRPAGTSPLVAVQLYLPPGPEQRFKKLASGEK